MPTDAKHPTQRETLASPRATADLLGLSIDAVHRLIRERRVRTERIKGTVFVILEDVEREAAGGAT